MPAKYYRQQLARPYRHSLLRALLAITFASGLLFAWINVARENLLVAGVELLMAGYSLALLVALPRARRLQRWILAYLIPFLTVMMVALAAPRSTAMIFIWVLLIPIVAHLLLGRRRGLQLSTFYILLAALIFYWRFAGDPEMMQPVVIANMAVLTLCLLIFSHVYEITREQSEARLVAQAHTDPLTGLPNRARLQDVFDREKRRSRRSQSPLSVVIIDLDHFKAVNDNHGHAAGDEALVHVARVLDTSLRGADLVARLGGEEFCLLLPGNDSRQALAVAEKLRSKLEAAPLLFAGQVIRLTVSGGIAEYGVDGEYLDELSRVADQKLYRAKADGRNRIVC